MFRAVDLNRAANSKGVVVSCSDRRSLRYKRQDHELLLRREPVRAPDMEPVQTVYLAPNLEWLPPHQHEAIDDGDRQRIADEIVAACRTFGIEVEVVGR